MTNNEDSVAEDKLAGPLWLVVMTTKVFFSESTLETLNYIVSQGSRNKILSPVQTSLLLLWVLEPIL